MNKIKRHLLPLTFIVLLTATVIVGCATANKAYNPELPVSETNLPYKPNETGTKIVAYGNQAAPLVPAPYNTPLIAVLGLATAAMTWLAKRKNDQVVAKDTQLTAVIKGVEDKGSADVKAAIQVRAEAAGVQPALDATVRKVT